MAKNDYSLGQVNMNAKRTGGGPGGRMRAYEKPKDFRGAWKMIFTYSKRYLIPILTAFVCAAGGAVLTLFGPGMLAKVTDLIKAGLDGGSVDLGRVLWFTKLLVFLYALSMLLSYLQRFLMVTLTQKIGWQMRTDISLKLNRIPLQQYDSASFGDVLSRVTNDIDTITDSLNRSVSEIVNAAAVFSGCVVMMLLTNVFLALIAIAASLLGFLGMRLIITKSQRFFSDRQKYLGELNGHIEEMYAGHSIVKAFNGEAAAKEEFEDLNNRLYFNNWVSQFLSGIMMPMMEFIGNFGYLAVCVAGAVLVKNGSITFGIIVAFIVYVKLFTQPLERVAQAATDLQSAAAAAERVFAFLKEPEMENEKGKPEHADVKEGHVVFDHLKFGYTPDRIIIHDFSADIPQGCKVAIVGPTGAGKTTLVNLLMRFYELNGGTIAIDGIPTTSVTREAVHAVFGMVLQDTWLFEGTIRDNIAYSRKNISDEELMAACRAVGLGHYINALPKGLDTELGDDDSMSAGQRQLLTIARVMVANPPLLILDEATSSVDTRTEQMVQTAMEKLTSGRTSFTIAHRLSTIRDADVILVMKNGDIVESGSHNELLARGGFYADLWQSQFVNAEAI